MSNYVDLQRQFHSINQEELEDAEQLASLSAHGYGQSIDWTELQKYSRVVILATAGSGKTTEMEAHAERIVDEGRAAFFIPLDSLDKESLESILGPAQLHLLAHWMEQADTPAWFFLDSVDELKLTSGKLDRALRRLANALGSEADRARIIISSRPSDWRYDQDMDRFMKHLPLPAAPQLSSLVDPEGYFLDAIRQGGGQNLQEDATVECDNPLCEEVKTVLLLPLNHDQVHQYVEHYGIDCPKEFIDEIEHQNAWTFANRPLDLSNLISIWQQQKKLGTRSEQHESMIELKLQDDPDRQDNNVLTPDQARNGVELLAWAMTQTRMRTLLSPDHMIGMGDGESSLNPASILPDWTPRERQSLLRQAIFDPATYGRLRFHHRSTQDYLAACHLRKLRSNGLSVGTLLNLLLAKIYNETVVLPSMRDITAWLSLWIDQVRNAVLEVEPELLTSRGDPQSLGLDARKQVITAFADAYSDGGWRGINIPLDEVRRICHPDLELHIRATWCRGKDNPDVREFLLELFWQGRINACTDLACAIAMDPVMDIHCRVIATKGLAACDSAEHCRIVIQSMLDQPENWPQTVIQGAVYDLYPGHMETQELIRLVERSPQTRFSSEGYGWVMRRIAEDIDPHSEQAIELRNSLSEVLVEHCNEESTAYQILGAFNDLSPALTILCAKQLAVAPKNGLSEIANACAIASRFVEYDSMSKRELQALQPHLNSSELRPLLFWAELKLLDDLFTARDDWERFYQTYNHGLIGELTSPDRTWLKAALSDINGSSLRPVALAALIANKPTTEIDVDSLRNMIGDNNLLNQMLSDYLAPQLSSPSSEAALQRIEQQKIDRRNAEDIRVQDWRDWRQATLLNPASAFASARREQTVANLYYWLRSVNSDRNSYNVWSKEALINAFGVDTADRAESAFYELWRETHPVLWSERQDAERGSIYLNWTRGFCGIAAEAAHPGWAANLSDDEVRVATTYATLELNGLALFVYDLVAAHPTVVETTIGNELSVQLGMGHRFSHLPLLQDISHSQPTLMILVLPRLLEGLYRIPEEMNEEVAQFWGQHLRQLIGIVCKVAEGDNRMLAAAECARRHRVDSDGPLTTAWLRYLFQLDIEQAIHLLKERLLALSSELATAEAIAIFATLFGGHGESALDSQELRKNIPMLGELIRIAYTYIRREDDEHHAGAYSPKPRDDAESARSHLLNTLLETPGIEARDLILSLATEEGFAHFPDRLRHLARERAAQDAERPAWSISQVIELEQRHHILPSDRDSLFAAMMDNLSDLQHEISTHDFSNINVIRSIDNEEDMQLTVALRLENIANGAYIIAREEEVVNRKRTDIRLLAREGSAKAVIEIKHTAKGWSANDLVVALRDQLVGQYLPHNDCKAGCLLLTLHKPKRRWKHPVTQEWMYFSDLLSYLGDVAKELEEESNYTMRLSVFGLDLTGGNSC